MSRSLASFALLVVASAPAACAPKFEPNGALSLNGAPLAITSCQVLAGKTGIVLGDAAGTRVELVLPPARLEAFQEIGGAPAVRVEQPGKPENVLGVCGKLDLRGEGYHEPAKRAASGALELDCLGTVRLEGKLAFKGCF